MTRGRVVLSVNSAWNIANFRAGLVRGLQADGWEVVAAAAADEHVERVRALGCRFVELKMDSAGTHPWRDFRLYRQYRALMREEAPRAFLGFTIKPNVYGSLAAHAEGVPVINNIAGLGTAFVRRSWLTHAARFLYRSALRKSRLVLFQNEDDRRYFIDDKLVCGTRTGRVPGSGVNLDAFAPLPLPPDTEPVRFLFVGRLLHDKGVPEFVEAARTLKRRGIDAEFSLLGPVGVDSPTAVKQGELDRWVSEGAVKYLGFTNDVRPHLAAAHCVVLPTAYREGVPRTLLEAASMGRPLIATDATGCRDIVDDGVNGYLVAVADPGALAGACMRFVGLKSEERSAMGMRSREKAQREFDEKFVLAKYRDALSHLPGQDRFAARVTSIEDR